MAVGLGALGLAPAQFWQTTPREFETMLKGRLGRGGPIQGPTRRELSELMAMFPD